jgi:hypothetical protein
VEDNGIDPAAKIQKGMLLELKVDTAALSPTMRKRRFSPRKGDWRKGSDAADDPAQLPISPEPAPRRSADTARRRTDTGGAYFRKVRILR